MRYIEGAQFRQGRERKLLKHWIVFRAAGRFVALAALAGMASAPLQAQFGGLDLKRATRSATDTDSDGCPKGKKKDVGRSILGGLAGQVVGNTVSRSGVGSWVALPDFEDQLTKSIACKLDPEEQRQAAEATLQATRGGRDGAGPAVGQSASWRSETREDVSGTSTVVGRSAAAEDAGMDCITVTDVIIVRGEETTANKRMCKPPGSARYSIMA